jgi:hypothetical protein
MAHKPIIIQYKSTQNLLDYIRTGKLPHTGPIVTATGAMANIFKKDEIISKKYAIRNMNNLLDRLLPDWSSSGATLEQFVELGNIIETITTRGYKKETAYALRRNKSEILASIKILTEIGIAPENLPDTLPEISLFKKVYAAFVQHYTGIDKFHAKMLYEWTDAKTFRDTLRKEGLQDVEAIYFQGFYYITPMQERLIEAFANLNIPIYFLNNYDESYGEIYAIWTLNHRFKGLQTIKIDSDYKNQPFWGEAFTSNSSSNTSCPHVTITEFHDIFSFVNYLSHKDANKLNVYSPLGKDLRDLFDTFFPQTKYKRHILAYPVGQYLFSLYDMWDNERKTLIFSVDKIRKCLATGWAGMNVADSRIYLDIYDKISIYFSDCKTMADWKDRAQLLQRVITTIVPKFNVKGSTQTHTQWHKAIGNPLTRIAPFSCNEEELATFIDVLDSIADDANLLFADDGDVDIDRHFRNIDRLIQSKQNIKKIYDDEKAIIKEMFSRLKRRPRYVKKCSTDNLAEAMAFFLGGKLDQIGNIDNGEDDTEGEPSSKDVGQKNIHRISDIEAAILSGQNASTELCNCDAQNMPGSAIPYPWPLTKDVLLNLINISEYAVPLLQDYMNGMENTMFSNRYLFFLAMQLPNINVSWITVKGGKKLPPSPYLMLLESVYQVKPVSYEGQLLAELPTNNPDTVPIPASDTVNITGDWANLTEIKKNDVLCHWRNTYDYVLQPFPTYVSTFHLNFYISNLISLLNECMEDPIEEIAKEFFAIFPAFNETERQEMLDFAKRKSDGLQEYTDYFDGFRYLSRRFYLEYLDNRIVQNILLETKSSYGDSVADIKCKYCPDDDVCYSQYHEGDAHE